MVLVEGFDYDTGRANGAGKSAIFNALSFALFDKIPRRITKSEILRNGTKHGYSQVEVQVNGRMFAVKRERPSRTTFFIDGHASDITQQEFEKQIGMNYEQFLITMYTAQDSDNKFIFLNDTGKKNFIMKIMDLDFSRFKEDTSKHIQALENEQEIIKSKIDNYKSTVDLYRSNITDPVEIQSRITSCKESIMIASKEINALSNIVEPDLSKYTDVESKLQTKLGDIRSFQVLVKSKRESLDKIRNEKPEICPDCSAELSVVNGKVVKADDRQSVEEHVKKLVKEINEYEKEIARESEIKGLINQIKSKVSEERKEYYDAQNRIAQLRNHINIEQTVIKHETDKLSKSKEMKAKTLELINQVKDLKTRLIEIDAELVLLKSVENIFDTTGAPAYIMDSIIDSFNESVTEYINEIWPNASYSLQTYKQNKDKSIRAKFSESLTINGSQRSIGSLSGGEIRALSLALDFAIIDVLGSKYSLSLNPVILDEPFNGLDSAGREMVVDILSKFSENRQVWVVDHASESKALFHDIVRVEKRNGISKIT